MDRIDIERRVELDPEAQKFAHEQWEKYDAGHGRTFERQPVALIARQDARVVGVAIGWTGMGMAYLDELIVDSELRGRGAGSQLLAAFEALASREGITRLALRTEKGDPAQVFYERHGWWVESELPDWYFGRTFLTMRKDLPSRES